MNPTNSDQIIELHVDNYRIILQAGNCSDVDYTLDIYRKALKTLVQLGVNEFILRSQQDFNSVKNIIRK